MGEITTKSSALASYILQSKEELQAILRVTGPVNGYDIVNTVVSLTSSSMSVDSVLTPHSDDPNTEQPSYRYGFTLNIKSGKISYLSNPVNLFEEEHSFLVFQNMVNGFVMNGALKTRIVAFKQQINILSNSCELYVTSSNFAFGKFKYAKGDAEMTLQTSYVHERVIPKNTRIRLDAVPASYSGTYTYGFSHWLKNGRILSNNNYLEFPIKDNGNYVAVFDEPSYVVNVSAKPANAYAILSGNGRYAYGDTATIYATPNGYYMFDKWAINGAYLDKPVNPYSFVVTNNVDAVAYFNTYAIN